MVNVRDFGAAGDGFTDDSHAIRAAVAAVKSGSILYFPKGAYRFAQRHPHGGAAILIAGISDVDIEFEVGAELVMDNADSPTRTGTSHGILIRGPASRIALHNIRIRWAQPLERSFGDGIRVVGYPVLAGRPPTGWKGPGGPVQGVSLSNCAIASSPQAGVIMMGVSDISISGLRVRDTCADGLHFNACRGASIDDYAALNTGDDGLALVTYYSEAFAFDSTAETFSLPTLTDWSDADFTITNVRVTGGKANGVRVAGASGVTIRRLTVVGVHSGSAVMVDSAAVGADVDWNYVASRGLRLEQLAVDSCETGVHLLARPSEAIDRRFTDFEVNITDATIRNCTNWSVRAESLSTQRARGLGLDVCNLEATSTEGGNGGIGLGHFQSARLGAMSIRHAQPVIAFSTADAVDVLVDRLEVTITDSGDPEQTAAPCAVFDESDGVIHRMDVNRASAPDSWIAVSITNDLACVDSTESPLAIRALSVDPATLTNPVSIG